MDRYQPSECRKVSETALPPLSSAFTILFENGKTLMIPAGRMTRRDAEYLIATALPALAEGACRILITWIGDYSADVFELTKEFAALYERHMRSEASHRWRTPLNC